MGDINLNENLEILPPVVRVNNYAWQISQDGITAQLNYYSVAGTIVKQETFYITGADFTPLANAVVQQAHVGKKFMEIIETAIRTKILALKGWTGTIP